MAVTRQKQAKGQKLDDKDVKPLVLHAAGDDSSDLMLTLISGERLRLKGGIGSPAEIVRERDGQTMAIDTERYSIDAEDADVDRSMVRRKKWDIG